MVNYGEGKFGNGIENGDGKVVVEPRMTHM